MGKLLTAAEKHTLPALYPIPENLPHSSSGDNGKNSPK
jgi:hypothetical protein